MCHCYRAVKVWTYIVMTETMQWYGFSPVWTSKWVLRFSNREKSLLHILHWYGFSPVWIRRWRSRSFDWVKHFPQTLHSYGLFPVWMPMWRFRCWDREKRRSHTLHWYGFSPVWIYMWFLRFCDLSKHLSHVLHWYGFSPVWTRMWLLRVCDWAKHPSYTLHQYGFSLVCVRMWRCWFHLLSKHLSHTWHWCCFFPLVCCWPLWDFERLEIWSWDVLRGVLVSVWSIVLLLSSPALVEQWRSNVQWSSLELPEYKHIVFIKIYFTHSDVLFGRIQNVNYLKQVVILCTLPGKSITTICYTQ